MPRPQTAANSNRRPGSSLEDTYFTTRAQYTVNITPKNAARPGYNVHAATDGQHARIPARIQTTSAATCIQGKNRVIYAAYVPTCRVIGPYLLFLLYHRIPLLQFVRVKRKQRRVCATRRCC